MGLGKFPADDRVNSDAGRTEERTAVYGTMVNDNSLSFADYLRSFYWVAADAEMEGKAVTAAARDYSHLPAGADKAAGDFVLGAVATYGYYDVRIGLSCDLAGVTGVFRISYLVCETCGIKRACDLLQYGFLVLPARYGVDYEEYLFQSLYNVRTAKLSLFIGLERGILLYKSRIDDGDQLVCGISFRYEPVLVVDESWDSALR